MSDLLISSLSLLLFIFGALNGALMLASPAKYRRLSFRVTYWPYRLLHPTAKLPVPGDGYGPDFLYRVQGLGVFAVFSCGAGLWFKMMMRVVQKVPPASVATLPQAAHTGGIRSSIFLGLFFIAMGVLLLLKPEMAHHWAEMRMGKLEPMPTKKNLRIGAGILALCMLAVGLLAIWSGVRCALSVCQ